MVSAFSRATHSGIDARRHHDEQIQLEPSAVAVPEHPKPQISRVVPLADQHRQQLEAGLSAVPT